MRFCVEYKKKYYRVAGSREIDFIIASPEKYLTEENQLPRDLPRSLTAEEVHDHLKAGNEAALKGFCPVTFKDGNFVYESLHRYFYFLGEKFKKTCSNTRLD